MGLFIGGFNIGLSLILMYEVYDLSEGLLWVCEGDAILAFRDDEIGDLSLIVKYCLSDRNVVVGASKLDPYELSLIELIFDSLSVGKTFKEAY